MPRDRCARGKVDEIDGGRPNRPDRSKGTSRPVDRLLAVPRYHFHLRDEDDVEDEEGQELPDLAAAIARARDTAREMACANILERHRVDLNHHIEVTDAEGVELFRVTFREAFEVRG